MFSDGFVLLLVGLFCLPSVISKEIDSTVFGNVNLNHEKDYYNRLLGNLVDINTKRLDSLKRSVALAHAHVGVGSGDFVEPEKSGLRYRNTDDDGALGVILTLNNRMRSSKQSSSEDSDSEDESMERMESPSANDQFTPLEAMMLRKSWCRSCSKKAAKRCRIACKKAVSSGCSGYDCRSRLKRRIKRECRSRCRSEFGVSDYDE